MFGAKAGLFVINATQMVATGLKRLKLPSHRRAVGGLGSLDTDQHGPALFDVKFEQK